MDILGDSLKHLIMFPRTEEETNTQRSLLDNCSRDVKQLPALLGLSQPDGLLDGHCRATAIQAYPRFLVNQARKEYAEQNNVTYDLVIMSRYDLYYYHSQIRPLQFMPDPAFAHKMAYASIDLFFAAEPETMNTLMELCWNIPVAKCLLHPTRYYCSHDRIRELGAAFVWPEGNNFLWLDANNISLVPVPALSMHYNRHLESASCDSQRARPEERQKEVMKRLEMLGVSLK